MFKRSLISVVGALALVPAALGATVHVRVEGKTQTIFGATEPALSVGAATPLGALETASLRAEFYYHLAPGPYVDQIERYPAAGSSGWVFKVNGVSPPVGADKLPLKDGDRVLWYWATFGAAGGPPTLLLRHVRKAGCYRVFTQDDSGRLGLADGALLHAGARVLKTKSGGACLRGRHGLVRATLAGAVRSNALP